MITSDEALITGKFNYLIFKSLGGGQGFLCSSNAHYFKNGFIKKKSNMFNERRSHSSCRAGEFIYVCGGINSKGEPLSACEKYSLELEKWIKMSNMVIAKSHLSLCNLNNQYIYSIGGENKIQSLLDIIERYSINIDTWEVIPLKIPIKIECVACIPNNNDILILGGYSCEAGSLNSVFSYDTINNTIRKLNRDLSQPGWSIYQPIKYGSNIHLFYGGEEGYPPHHLVYEI